MKSPAWIKLLKRIPPELCDNLILVTTVGQEMSLQSFVRLDKEFLVFRGRLAGSQDTDRAFFVPYDQINYLGMYRPVKEEVLQAMFDRSRRGQMPAQPFFTPEPTPPPTPAATLVPEPIVETTSPEPQPLTLEPAVPLSTQNTPPPSAMPSKAALLARIKSRSQANGNNVAVAEE